MIHHAEWRDYLITLRFYVIVIAMIWATSVGNAQWTKEEAVRARVVHALSLGERTWSRRNIETCTKVLIAGERLYNVSHVKMLGIMLTESDMRIRCVGRPNRNGTRDYGITQQNSDYLEERYAAARKALDAVGISYSDDLFDLAVNTMAGIIVVHDFREQMQKKGVEDRMAHVLAYNVGVNGYFMASRDAAKQRYQKRFESYYTRL